MLNYLTCLAEQVRRRPQAPAIVVEDLVIYSYESLWQQAQALAFQLNAEGVSLGDIVGIHLNKTPDFIVCMLATWMCRAAFVPLDPEFPEQRLQFMTEECQPRCILSEHPISWARRGSVLAPSTIDATKHSVTSLTFTKKNKADDLAYIIYSSGSSGQPKGVEVLQRGLVPIIKAQIAAFRIDPNSRVLWLLAPGFDASQSDIGTTLLSGASLHIEDGSLTQNPRRLMQIIRDRNITHLDVPPSLLRLLDASACPDSLKTIVIGGEVCSAKSIRVWASHCRVFNVYGPTEATICTSMIECDTTWDKPFIGEPIPGVHYHVVAGELYIAGPCLARGYRNRPSLTKEHFIEMQGVRYFRTGDRVRLHGQAIEFVGRIDRQIKHLGVLVAPEEIESKLMAMQGVQECAVVQELVGERHVLRAYCSLQHTLPGDITQQLKRELPRAMVPQVCAVNELPHLPNGKVDFVSLASMHQSSIATKTSMESRMAMLWQHVLGPHTFNSDSDFFSCGGNSLGVVELLVAAERQGIILSADQIYRNSRLADLAQSIDQHFPAGRSSKELENWAQLPIKLTHQFKPQPATIGNRIFLTGVTGFLGSHLLIQILQRSNEEIMLLVRAANITHAWQRIDTALNKANILLTTAMRARCHIILGDLRKLRFGLTTEAWQELGETVHRVYHCAAAVNLLEPLESLAETNIGGCQRMLELMSIGVKKELHYASTLSVFVGSNAQGRMYEDDELTSSTHLYGGYAQSKWAAEKLLRQCPEKLGMVFFYRPGLLIGSNKKNSEDWINLYIRSLLDNVETPEPGSPELCVDLTPVDYAAAAIAHISLLKNKNSTTFHIANAQAATMYELHEIVRCFHSQSKKTKNTAFQMAIKKLAAHRSDADNEHWQPCDLFRATGFKFDCRNTLHALKGSTIDLPAPANRLLQAYVEQLAQGNNK